MKDVAVGIIERDGEVLVCQRKRTVPCPLQWEFPGGKLEQGETPAAALARELREELSIDAVVEGELHRQEWIYPAFHGRGDRAFRVHYLRVASYSGELHNNTFEQLRWVRPADLQQMDILEGNREAVALLIQQAKDHDRTAR
jgi:8-oxo-dGTP diphosphatase